MTVSSERAAIIVEKAEFVGQCIRILAERQSVDPDEYVERVEIKDVVERRFETMTQACIDIARILLKELGVTVPRANPETTGRLATEGVLSSRVRESSHRYGRQYNCEGRSFSTHAIKADV